MGIELYKAELSLKYEFKYIQDKRFIYLELLTYEEFFVFNHHFKHFQKNYLINEVFFRYSVN